MKNLKKCSKLLFGLMIVLILSSCVSSNRIPQLEDYDKVQVIDVKNQNAWTNPNSKLPITAVIQPDDLTISPIIDISTLKAETNRETQVSSSTLIQETKKEEIKEEFKTNPNVDTTLDDLKYGETSGSLALNATASSFNYIDSHHSFVGAIATYDYIEGQIYEIITSPNAITDLRLKPEESIAGSPIVSNNGTAWQFSMGTSIEDGKTVQHLFIKPTTVGLDTSMIVLTNERTYYFRIASFENSYMTALRFNYPQMLENGTFVPEEVAEHFAEFSNNNNSETSNYSFDISKANYNYKIKKYKGNPSWIPQIVFSDLVKTYIQFPLSVLYSNELPSIYVLRNNAEELVNFRMMGENSNMFEIDTVIGKNDAILLKSSPKEQVKITRTDLK